MSYPAKCFDAHCHLLNKDYLLRELAEIFLLSWWRAEKAAREGDGEKTSSLAAIEDLLAWIVEFLGTLNWNEEQQYDFLQDTAKAFWGHDRQTAVVPLMMDIRYMFAPALDKGQKARPEESYDGKDGGWIADTRSALLAALQRAGVREDEALTLATEAQEALVQGKAEAGPYAYSRGFCLHRDALIALKTKHPENLYPFFAVDPRRRGVVQAVTTGDFVGKGKPFRGVKLYPRLGSHPECDDLAPLFDWCDSERIPIITHCGPGGFPPLMDTHGNFGAPSSFASVLNSHNTLIINFAHFGSGNRVWAEDIARLMVKHPCVYSDLACYEKFSEVQQFKNLHWNKDKVRDRTMFGTDYGLMYLFNTASLGTYYSNLLRVFGKVDLEHMNEVASAFLG